MGEAGHAVECALQRNRNLLLDLLGCEAGRSGRHLGVDVAEQRIGVDRQLRPGVDAVDGEKQRYHADEEAIPETERDEVINHSTRPRPSTRHSW
jgi:hypothetical protein